MGKHARTIPDRETPGPRSLGRCLLLSFLVFSLAGLPGSTPTARGGARRVLVLYSYSRHLPWVSRVMEGLDGVLAGYSLADRPHLFEEFMDASRIGDVRDSAIWAAYLAEKYRNIPLDAVMTDGYPAGVLLLEHPELFPAASRHLFQFNPGSFPGKGRGDERMFSSPSDLEQALKSVKYVLPRIRNIVVVSDRSLNGLAWTEQVRRVRERLGPSLSVEIWDEFTEAELLERAAGLPKYAALFYLPVQRDREGRTLVPYTLSTNLAATASVPVFSHFDSLLGSGIAGGYLVSGVRLGRLIGSIAVLGESAAPASQEAYSSATIGYQFDSRVLARWSIPESGLPPGSSVLYRKQTFLERYSGYILGSALVFLLETLLLVALIRSTLQRKNALTLLAAERALLERRVLERTADLDLEVQERRLSEERERAGAREKENLLRELQHRVKNSMAVISSLVSLETGRARNPETRDALSKLGSRIEALTVLYGILYDTGSVASIDLADYLQRVADAAAESLGADVKGIVLEKALDEVPMGIKNSVALGLIVNELVTNTMKYAFPGGRGGRISVSLERRNDRLVLEVSDDGVGLPEGFDISRSEGFGMSLVSILVQQLGADFSAGNREGARFRIEMPA